METTRGLKAKTIKGILRRKFDDFLASIEDENVRSLVADNSIITGGSIASLLIGEKVNDYDVYFTDKRTTEAVAHYYVEQFKKNPPPRHKSTGNDIPISVRVEDDGTEEYETHYKDPDTGEWHPVTKTRRKPGRVKIVVKSVGVAGESGDDGKYEYFEADPDADAITATTYVENAMKIAQDIEGDGLPKYRPVFLSSNAITLSHDMQLILRFYGDPEEIHENYDFVHCTNYWTSHNNNLTLQPAALECLLSRELRYQGSRYPVCSLFRIRKFIERGWSINAGQILKACMQVAKLDLEDTNVLEEQLTGVDAAYFAEIIKKLREKFPDGQTPSAYLLEVIDRMF